MSFTRVMIDLGNSTNLSATEAASALAKFANVTSMSAEDYDKLGSVIVGLGNNFATTEADIVSMATRLAGAGDLTGLTQAQIMGLATAMSSVGIEAEMGGSAMSTLLKKIQVAVETGSESLDDFAKVAGMTGKEFKDAFQKDASKALTAFISGLQDTERNGKSAISVLDDMGIKEIRLSDTILRLSNASNVMNDAIELANNSWKENTALTNEANKRYETLKSKIQIAMNKIQDIAITLGNKLMPSIEKILDKVGKWADKFNELDDKTVEVIVNLGLMGGALSPVLTGVGKLTTGVGEAVKAYGSFREGLGKVITKAEESGSKMSGVLKVIQGLISPVGLACTAIAVGIGAIVIASNNAQKEVQKDFETMGNSATNFIKGIDNAQSHLSSFNSTLFASAEEQQALKNNMNEVQKGITDICKTASDERRGYTQEEITQLDEYFTRLRELKDRELQIQAEIATAITQQAQTNAESFQGSLEEYKVQSQEWIKTATEQKDATIKLIEEGTIEEVALLNQRYKTEEERQTEAYKEEYQRIMEHKQAKIDSANDEVAKVNKVYADGYLERSKQNDGFYSMFEEYNQKLEEENERHNKKIEDIENGHFNWVLGKTKDTRLENNKHSEEMKKIWQKIAKDMTDSQAEQMGVWLALQTDTEVYGGEISQEAQKMVDNIISSYDSMPEKTRDAMKNAMQPMIEEMQNKQPSLFAKASNIANGILSRLKKAFDIHSPSRKTRKIFKQVMEGAELGLEDEKKKLYNNIDNITKNVNDNFDNIDDVKIGLRHSNISGNNSNLELINYDKLYDIFYRAMLKALNSCKMELDEDGFIRLVDNRMTEVM